MTISFERAGDRGDAVGPARPPRTLRRATRAPVEYCDAGVWLYAPTEVYDRWRLVWRDPLTGTRPNRSFRLEPEARIAFADTKAYVTATAAEVAAGRQQRRVGGGA